MAEAKEEASKKERARVDGSEQGENDARPSKAEAIAKEVKEQQARTEESKHYYLLLMGGINKPNLIRLVEEVGKITSKPETTELTAIVTSFGGGAHSAFQMARVLRGVSSNMTSVVPLYAKSAATLLVLASDEIVMSPQSELGPLDTQIEHPDGGQIISALDYGDALTHLSGATMDLGINVAGKARQEFMLGKKDSLELGLNFAERHLRPLVGKLDPSLLYRSLRELDVAYEYGVSLMEDCMFAGEEGSRERAKSIADRLVRAYKTHGFVIDMKEAKALGLKVLPSGEYEHSDIAWALTKYYLGSDEEEEYVIVWNEDEFASLYGGDESEEN